MYTLKVVVGQVSGVTSVFCLYLKEYLSYRPQTRFVQLGIEFRSRTLSLARSGVTVPTHS